jgi:anti-sigma factor RsiW
MQATGDDVDRIAREVQGAHVRSLLVEGHLHDVASTDQHTVKPWFDGRIDFAPPVTDEVAAGFPLLGGRLDYVAGHPAAALVYGRRLHHINVFVWPEREGSGGAAHDERNGYVLEHWTANGMSFWAVSDLNPAELLSFAQLLQRREAGAPAAAP